ncbi:MAG: type II toxin-antitoxin system HicB family antitoxin [bacterium]
MKKTYQYTVNFKLTEDGVYLATVPALRGCVSYGYTIEEAEKNIREAMECHIESMIEDGLEIPQEEPGSVLVSKFIEVSLSLV